MVSYTNSERLQWNNEENTLWPLCDGAEVEWRRRRSSIFVTGSRGLADPIQLAWMVNKTSC